METWKLIDNIPYEVSDLGNIRHVKFKKVRKLKASPYRMFTFGGSTLKVARMVGFAFVDGWFEGALINHKDLDKGNDHYLNLEWTDYIGNAHHAVDNGAQKGRPTKPLTQLSLAGVVVKEWPSKVEASRVLGINSSALGNCARGLSASAGGYKWRYKVTT